MEEISKHKKLDFLSGGGEMGERIRNFDWSKNPLGNPENWDSNLKTCVRIMLTSPQPMFIWWGNELINVYNDAYRDVLGGKHPAMMGVSGKIVWVEIWEELWTRVKTIFERNEGTFDDSLMLIIKRNGYEEETYFKFSYNPIPGTRKTTEGLLCVCSEETPRIFNERALDTLRKLGAIIYTEKSLDIIYRNVAEALANNPKDFPFALIYKITGESPIATVAASTAAASTGIDKSQNIFPANIDLTKPTAITQDFCEAFTENKMVVSEIKTGDITLPKGGWQTTPKQFIHLPISPAGGTQPYCIISAALNPYRKFDDKYFQFCQLIADRVSIEINKMLALEIEAKRAEALAEIDRAKIIFFSNISHEFRTPLTLMLSPLEEILNQKKNNLNETEKRNIEIAHRNSMRLLKLVNTLLDFSNIEKGRQQAAFSLVDIVALTKNLAANFRAIIEKAGMELVVKADTINQLVYVDKQMWEKIVFNLLSNAFKYTLKGKITVEILAENNFAVLKVIDTGVGIPANELPKMFERFHRIENVAGRTFEGTGIGLSLIKEMVKLHHGEIRVDSELDKGSVFTVKIPLGNEHLSEHQLWRTENDLDEITSDIYLAEIETLLETEKKEAVKLAAVQKKSMLPTVLVVDDTADMRKHISTILSDDFNVITANHGIDALHSIKRTAPDLVLADIWMPVMDGIGLLKEIRRDKATASIPVILLTARASEDSKVAGWEIGANDYMVKPFSSRELIARIKAQLNLEKLRQSLEGNVRNLFMVAPAAIAVLKGSQHVFELANEKYLQLVGNRDIIGKPIREALPELKGQGFYELLDKVYATGEPFIGNEVPVQLDEGNRELKDVYLNFVYQPSHDSEGEINGILVHAVEVTEQVESRKKIEESNQKIRNLIAQAPVAMCLYKEPDFKVDIVNEKMLQLWGKGLETVINKPLFEAMPDVKGQGFEDLLHKVYSTGESYSANEVPLNLLRNGIHEKIYVNLLYEPYRESDGTITGIVEVANDVTEQVTARKKIEESEELFNSFGNNIQNLAWIAEGDGNIFWYNQRWLDYTGLTLAEMKGWGWQKVHHPDHVERIVEAVKVLWMTNKPFELTFPLRRFDGQYRWFLTRAVPISDEHGKIYRWIGTNTDIDEKVQTENKIRESEERFRSLAQTLPQLVWVTDAQGNAEFVSLSWKKYSGIEPGGEEEWKAIVHPDDYENINAAWGHSLTTGNLYSFEVRLKSKEGKYRWYTVKGEPVLDKENNIVKWVGAFTDIHEQKLKEEKKDEFISIASHEMKTPLTTSKAYLQMLELALDENNEEASLYAKKASQSVNRLNELITELLDVSKIRLGKLNYTITTFNFNDMVDSTIENIQLLSPTYTIIKSGKVSEDVTGDKDRLQQVVINLLSNAIKYSPHAKQVFVTVGQENDHIKVSVKDQGVGMSKDNLTKIFEKYHRIEEHAIQFQGLGIGLFISYEIIQRHHGKLWAESEIGEGSTFHFTLPLSQIPAQ